MTQPTDNNLTQREPSRAEQIGLKVVKYANRTIRRAEDIVFIILLLIAIWFIVDTIYVYYHARADILMPNKPEDIETLQQMLSEDAIGWITLDDTSIDYPVMQGVDNYEYLNKDPYGNYSLAGSIFLDARNARDFSDDYSVIYGHHMSGGYMFGALDAFEEQDYFEKHTTGTLMTLRGTFPIETIGFLYTDAGNMLVFDPEGDQSGLPSFIEENAINYRKVRGDNILALTTCRSPTSTRRACLFVRILDEEGTEDGGNTHDDLQQKSDEVLNANAAQGSS